MRGFLNYLPQRLSMCIDILTKPSVLLLTTTDVEKLKMVEMRSVNITNNDTLLISTSLQSHAIAEKKHFAIVDNLFSIPNF